MNKKFFIITLILGGMIFGVLAPYFVSAATYSNGTLIRAEGDSKVFVINNNKKRWLRSEAVFNSYKKSWDAILVLPKAMVDKIPYNNLIRADGIKVYALNDLGYKRHIFNPDIFNSYGLSWADVADINQTELVNYPDCNLIQQAEDKKIYYIDETIRRWVKTIDVFSANNFNWDAVQIINTEDMGHYDLGADVTDKIEIATPTPTPTPTSTPTPTPTPTPAPGSFSVVLASDNPAAANIPYGATGISFLKFTLTGIETLNEVVIARTGLGLASDFSAVYLYDGATRLTSARSVDIGTNKAIFININLAVGTGKTLTVKADIANSSALITRQDAFNVVSINGAEVSGVNGNMMAYTNVPIATATISNTSASWSVGMNSTEVELAKFSVQETGGASDLIIHGITLRHDGTLDKNYIKNLVLKVGSTQLATCSALIVDKAIFSFTTPYTLQKGKTKNFVVYGDITAGRTNETIQFYMDEDSDLNAIDGTYGYGPILTNNWDQSSASKTQTVTISGAQVTISFSGPAASKYNQASTAEEFLNFSISSGKNLTVKRVKLGIIVKSAGTGVVQSDADYGRVKNIKIVDASSGNILVGPLSSASSGTTWSGSVDTGYYEISSDSFEITGGTARNLSLRADIDSNFTSDRTIEMSVDFSGSNYLYDAESNQYVLAGNIIPNILNGNKMTIAGASLNLVRASTPVSTTVVKGAQNVEALGIILTAGVGDSITLTRLNVRVYGDSDGVFNNSGYGDSAANTIVQTLSLYDDAGNLIKGPVNLTLVGTVGSSGGYYKAEFSNLAYQISVGVQKKFLVKANLLNTFYGTKYFALDVLPSSDVEAEDSRSNFVDFSLQTTNFNLGSSPNPAITCSQAGSLTVGVDPGTPIEGIVVAGTSGTVFTKYKFSATNEAMIVKGLKLANSSAVYDRDFGNVTLSYTNSQGSTEEKNSFFAGGFASFPDGQLGIYVPKDSSTILTIKADILGTSSGAQSGDIPKITLVKSGANLTDDFVAEGVSSGNKIYGATNAIALDNTSANQMIVRKSSPTLASSAFSDTMLGAGEKTFYKWSVSANAGGDIGWKLIIFNVTGILGDGTNLRTIGNDDESAPTYDGIYTITNGDGGANADANHVNGFKIYKGTTQVSGIFYYRSRITSGDTGGYYLVFAPDTEQQIAAGGTENYELRGNFTVAATGASGVIGNISTKIADLAVSPTTNTFDNIAGVNNANSITSAATSTPTVSFVWSDRSAASHSAVTSDWANDYKISGIPTSTLTMSK